MSKKKELIEEAKADLLKILPPNTTVHTCLRNVSRSGMSRSISLHLVDKDGGLRDISHLACQALGGRNWDERRYAIKVGGCGMDMGFDLVYRLSWTLYRQGFKCVGEGCPSNDHSNSPHPPRDGKMHHTSGGYALRHKWI